MPPAYGFELELLYRGCFISMMFAKVGEDRSISLFHKAYMSDSVRFAEDHEVFEKLLTYCVIFSNPKIYSIVGDAAGSLQWTNLISGSSAGMLELFESVEHASRKILNDWFGQLILATDADFDEWAYLIANDDVLCSIKAGGFYSGRDHFNRCGRSEQRKQRVFAC